MDAKFGKLSIVAGGGPALSLAGDGVWRFPAEVAQVSALVTIVVQNLSAATILPHAIAFWGLRWENLTPQQRCKAMGITWVPTSELPP